MFQRHRSAGVPWFFIALVAIGIASAASGRQALVQFDGPGYRVQLSVSVIGTTEHKIDYDLTTFKKADGSVLLRSHVGLHPDFNEETSRQERINGMPARRWMRTDGDKKTCADVLITTRSSEHGGPFVHFWYCLESDVDVRQAESIIRSIRAEP